MLDRSLASQPQLHGIACAGRATRFEFPLELDVYKYTVEGLAEQEAAQAATATPAAFGPDPAPNPGAEPGPEPARTSEDEGATAGPGPGSTGAPAAAAGPGPGLGSPAASRTTYVYQLKGIVVHSGTAFAGHYYSYIKVTLPCSCRPSELA